MTRRFTEDHEPARFFVYRTPLLPFETIESWSAGLTGAPERVAEESAIARQRLRALVSSPVVREAIFLGSPDLDGEIDGWLLSADDERFARVERAVARYVCRMATRCTPFGIFAGWSVGEVGEQLALPVGDARRHARLDMDLLVSLTEALGRDPAVRRLLSYRPNGSIACVAGKVRFAQSRLQGGKRLHCLVAVDDSDYLETVLRCAREAARFDELAASITGDDVTEQEAAAFINDLIDEQILVSDLVPAITGSEPLQPLIDATRTLAPSLSAALDEARLSLDAVDREPLGIPPQRYRAIAADLARNGIPAQIDRLFQVDMSRAAAGAVMDRALADEIARAIDVFHRISEVAADRSLERFRNAFVVRYGDNEVPLLIALDDEIGVGFGSASEVSPLLAGIANVGEPAAETAMSQERTMVLIRRVHEVIARGDREIRLTDADVEALTPARLAPLPDSFCAMVSPASDGSLLLEKIAGPSGAFAFGRFAHADPRLRREIDQLLRDEEAVRPDAVYAEIVHLPEGRVGNVILRPQFRPYEIEFLGRGAVDDDHRIGADDLMVSVLDNRILLRSRRLDREVVPRMTTAHSFTRDALGVYRFLCLLQSQGVHGRYEWAWGPLVSAPFLPRVSYGRWTFARARWLLERRELEALDASAPEARIAAVAELREKRRLPPRAFLADDDNELLVDFANPVSVENFIQLVRRRRFATLIEVFPDPVNAVAHGDHGTYRAEVVLPFSRVRTTVKKTTIASAGIVQQSFAPGSEWLYGKLYCGDVTADAVLRETIAPLVSSLLARSIDGWFFVRYSDADGAHLRLRLHGEPLRLLHDVVPRLSATFEPLLGRGLLRKVVYDTYDRETARYGGNESIEIAERIFRADSEAVVRLLGLHPGDAGLDARWRLCVRGIDMLLDDFGFDLEQRLAIIGAARRELGRELDPNGVLNEKLAAKLRSERKKIECLFDDARPPEELRHGIEVLRHRSIETRPLAARIRQTARSRPVEEIVISVAHMFANRLLRSAHRMQEMVMADFLERTYRSFAARRKSAISREA